MLRLASGLFAFMVPLLPITALSKGPYGKLVVGHWSGGAFTNDKTGKFSGCIASANYKSGISVHVHVTANFQWQLGFAHDNWKLTPGTTFPIALTFDGSVPYNVTGIPLSRILVGVEMPANSALINHFRRARVMTAYANGQLFQFNLDDTSVLLPALVNCVATVNRGGIAAAGNFIVPRQPKPAPSVAGVGPSLKSDNAAQPSAELQFEAIELATNFILRTSMPNARVLSRSETPVALASAGAA